MVSIRELSIGMRVKIVNEWDDDCGQNGEGRMDHWLGQIMTVRETYSDSVMMQEDSGEGILGHGWYWNAHCIDYIVPDEPFDCDMPDFSELSVWFGG